MNGIIVSKETSRGEQKKARLLVFGTEAGKRKYLNHALSQYN